MSPPRASKHPPPGLKPVDLHVLMALRGGERHGYGLVQDIAEQSGGRLHLAPASLYTVLQRLLDWSWIEESADTASESGGPPRRVYRLAPAGERALQQETVRLRELLPRLERATAPGDRESTP